MEWQPIKTAPKDGTRILGAWQCLNKSWDFNVVQFYDGLWFNYYFDGTHKPTKWKPLDPPK
jgi:hypothetical protein